MASKTWSFLSSHGLVLAQIIRHPNSTKLKTAQSVGLTERTVYLILRDLENEGYLVKSRIGRRTSYQMNPELKLRHPLLQNVHFGDFLAFLTQKSERRANEKEA